MNARTCLSAEPTGARYRFDEFEIDGPAHVLSRDGEEIHLELSHRKAFPSVAHRPILTPAVLACRWPARCGADRDGGCQR